jgi:hypothetical protein
VTDIFFSYSSKDRDRVAVAHKALTERGFDVFWDLQVPAGIDWDRWIHARLDQSRCVIVFWTANSAASDNVRHEVAIAREQGKLLQVMLEPLATRDLPMGALADQAVKLMDWRGNATDPEWAKLIAAVEEKATPQWLRQKVRGLEVTLKGERQRVTEADVKARTLEEAHAREVAAQGDLRRERDKLQEERDFLIGRQRGTGKIEDKARTVEKTHKNLIRELSGLIIESPARTTALERLSNTEKAVRKFLEFTKYKCLDVEGRDKDAVISSVQRCLDDINSSIQYGLHVKLIMVKLEDMIRELKM